MSNICSLQNAINQSNQGNQQQQLNQASTGSLSSAALLGNLTSGYGQAGSSLIGPGTTGYLTTTPSYGYLGTQPQWATTYGYILNRAGKEYVVTDEKSVEKFLKLAGIQL